jgi:uncharacterized protein DUF6515
MKPTVIAAMALTTMAALSPFLASCAYAQHYERGFAHPAPRYETPHWAFDDRFHHDHFYPVPDYSVAALPPGHLAVNFGGGRFFFHAGVWYRGAGAQFVVVRPPVGIVLPVLPPAYTTVWIAGAPYYYANDVYYSAVPGGYAVVQPPMDASAPPPQAPAVPPQAAAAPALAGSYYYCESTKSYYPYSLECKEGWHTVPATPPQTR